MPVFREVEGPRGVGNEGTDLEIWYTHSSITDEQGQTVFTVGHYESSTEDPYYSAAVPTVLPPEIVFDHADVLYADFERRSDSYSGDHYDWIVDLDSDRVEEKTQRPISLRRFHERHPGNLGPIIRLDSAYGAVVYKTKQQSSVESLQTFPRVYAIFDQVVPADPIADFMVKASGSILPKELIKGQISRTRPAQKA
jgi:hypothetical protein